jgi:hypothetical protein
MGVLIDPHKKSVNAAAAIDEQGELAGHETFPANREGLRALQRWAKSASPSVALGGCREPPVWAVPWLSGSSWRARR